MNEPFLIIFKQLLDGKEMELGGINVVLDLDFQEKICNKSSVSVECGHGAGLQGWV